MPKVTHFTAGNKAPIEHKTKQAITFVEKGLGYELELNPPLRRESRGELGRLPRELETRKLTFVQQMDLPFDTKARLATQWGVYAEGQYILPPFSMVEARRIAEETSAVAQSIDVMIENTCSFGGEFVTTVKSDMLPKEPTKAFEKEKAAERDEVEIFFETMMLDEDFVDFKKKIRRDLETTGQAYIEVIRTTETREITKIRRLLPSQFRVCEQEEIPHVYVRTTNVWVSSGKFVEVKERIARRFRRFVQVNDMFNSDSINIFAYFKEYGDPRPISHVDGKVVPDKELRSFPKNLLANEIVHLKIGEGSGPYGMPRWMSAKLDMQGRKIASIVNYSTIKSTNNPSGLLTISGDITDESQARLQSMHEAAALDRAKGKIVILQGATESPDGTDATKFGWISLDKAQTADSNYGRYISETDALVHSLFRIPPLFFGRGESYARNVAEEIRRTADGQVFAPARDDFDRVITDLIQNATGTKHWRYRSGGPPVTDPEKIVGVLSAAERTGAVTPQIARDALAPILDAVRRARPIDPDKVDPHVPYGLQLVERQKTQADPTLPEQTVGPVMPDSQDKTVQKSAVGEVFEEIGRILSSYAPRGNDETS